MNNLKSQLLYQARKEAIRRFAYKGDVLNWGKYLFPDKFSLPFCGELHQYFVKTFEDEFTKTLAPRGHAKTTIEGFLLPMFYGLVRPEVFQHFLNVQNTASKAINLNVSMKTEFENNEMLIDIYGDMKSTEDKWTEKTFVLGNGVIYSCVGTGESLRGIQYNNKRPDCIIVDDLYDDEDINNANRVNKKNQWFWSTLYPARAKSKKNAVHIQGTAISNVDLMHQGGDAKVFKIIDNDNNILWKELWTKEEIEKEKTKIGSIIFSREYLNEVRDDETAIIKQSWIKYYKQSELEQSGIKIIKSISGLDPACGEKALNDFSAYSIIHISEHYDIYIEKATGVKNSFNDNMNMIDSWNDRYNPDIFAIEGVSGFKQLTDEVRRTKNVKLRAVGADKDKITRLEAQSFRWENGKVYINSEMSKKDIDTLVYQLINNYPEHDDVRDAVIIAMEQIDARKEVKVRRM